MGSYIGIIFPRHKICTALVTVRRGGGVGAGKCGGRGDGLRSVALAVGFSYM